MSERRVPISDILTTGWTGVPTNSDLWSRVDESLPGSENDSDYIYTQLGVDGDGLVRFNLSDLTELPGTATLRVRLKANIAGEQAVLRFISVHDSQGILVPIFQGDPQSDIGTEWTTFVVTLSLSNTPVATTGWWVSVAIGKYVGTTPTVYMSALEVEFDAAPGSGNNATSLAWMMIDEEDQ